MTHEHFLKIFPTYSAEILFFLASSADCIVYKKRRYFYVEYWSLHYMWINHMTASLPHHFISGRMHLGNMRPYGHIAYVQMHDFYKCASLAKVVSIFSLKLVNFASSICQMPRHLLLWVPPSLLWSPEVSLVNRLTPFAIRNTDAPLLYKYKITHTVTSPANLISLAIGQLLQYTTQIVFLYNFLHDRKLLFGELFRHKLCLQEHVLSVNL